MANVYTYEDVVPSLIANTIMQKVFLNGVHKTFRVTPVDGYVLHDSARDWYVPEENVTTRGYTTGTATCAAAYDFNTVTMIDGYTAVGAREFFARPRSEVPEDQIFGGGDNNDHEIM